MKEDFEKELNELSPFLADLKKQQKQEPFKTPRLYFDTLADKVLDKAKEEKNTATVPPQYNQRQSLSSRINGWLSTILQPRLALSGFALVLVFAAGWYVINQQKPALVPQGTPTTTVSDINKNNAVETPPNHNAGVATTGNNTQSSTDIEPKGTKLGDKKTDIVDTPSIPNALEVLKPVITHPKSGLTEEEIEEFLKDALVDEDLDDIGGK